MGEGGPGGEVLTDLAPAVRPPAPEPPPSFAVADVPSGKPYGTGKQEILPLVSASASSAGSVTEVGVRRGDVIGRLDVLALASLGSDGWPSGGAIAGVWRGWPVEMGFHVYDVRENPSRQRGPQSFGSGLDLDRRGAELSASWDRRWSGARLILRTAALSEEIEPRSLGESAHRSLGSLSAGWTGRRQWGGFRMTSRAGVHWETGQTDGASWRRYGGSARLDLDQSKTGLTFAWRRDGSSGAFPLIDRYQVGGPESSVLPRTATSSLIAEPALPFGVLTGEEHESQRAELRLGLLPAPVFWERHRVWDGGTPRGGWLTLAGLEWRFSLDPLPIGRVPALDFRIGVARILDEPFPEETLEGDTRWWLTAVWRP